MQTDSVEAARRLFLDDADVYGRAETTFIVLAAAYGLSERTAAAAAMTLDGGIESEIWHDRCMRHSGWQRDGAGSTRFGSFRIGSWPQPPSHQRFDAHPLEHQREQDDAEGDLEQ